MGRLYQGALWESQWEWSRRGNESRYLLEREEKQTAESRNRLEKTPSGLSRAGKPLPDGFQSREGNRLILEQILYWHIVTSRKESDGWESQSLFYNTSFPISIQVLHSEPQMSTSTFWRRRISFIHEEQKMHLLSLLMLTNPFCPSLDPYYQDPARCNPGEADLWPSLCLNYLDTCLFLVLEW